MADTVVNFLQTVIKNPYFLVVLVSMFPLVELKGAIPIGTKLGLKLYESALCAYVGSTVVVFVIFFLFIYVIKLFKKIPPIKRFAEKLEAFFQAKASKLAEKTSGQPDDIKRRFLIRGLFIFVAVPLPLTGVWTGTAIAVFLGLGFIDSLAPLCLGNFIAGLLITLLTLIFKDYVNIIIDAVFLLALLMLIVFIVKLALQKPDSSVKTVGDNSDGDNKNAE